MPDKGDARRVIVQSAYQLVLFMLVAGVAFAVSPSLRAFWWQFLSFGLLSIIISTLLAFMVEWRRLGGHRTSSSNGQ